MSRKQHQLEEKLMTAILTLIQADIDAQAANAQSIAAIAADVKTLLAAPAVTADPAIVAKLTQIQADLGDTATAVTNTATSTTATAVAAAAAPPETIVAPSVPTV